MTPETILAAFESRGPLPRAALAAAGQFREELVPAFLDRIDRLTGADLAAAEDDRSFIFIYHLLAEWRETRAYRPMLRLLRTDPEFIDALMGDGITECAARVVTALFDGDLLPIFEAALDDGAEEYVRSGMLDALAMLVVEAPPLAPAVADFLRQFPSVAGEATPDIVWCAWSMAVSDLGLTDMAPAVRQVYADERIDPFLARIEDFEQELAETVRTGRPAGPKRRGPITDAIAELSSWYCFSKAYLDAEAKPPARVVPFPAAPKVGRNDPCPCGSGRKYKKCCLP